MSDFSIEAAQERINNARTKQYFAEVYSGYVNGNYRSAVVVLWSVVVCDILFKLDDLRNLYADAGADTILREIDALRIGNPKSPEWEWELVKKVKDRTQLLEEADYVNLRALQNHRHLSAHPVLTNFDALFSPPKEQCRAHLRNALDAVLTKPPIMTKKVFDALMEDIEQKQSALPDDGSLKRYLEAKYWGNLTAPVEDAIVRSLWRLVFKSTDQRCEQNRVINYRTLHQFYKRRASDINALIQGEPAYFSELSFTGSAVTSLVAFLSFHPNVFALLTEAAKTPLRNYVNTSIDHFMIVWFMSSDVPSHIQEVRRRVDAGGAVTSPDAYGRFYSVAKDEGHKNAVCEIGIVLYGQSENYNMADERCENFVLPYLSDFDDARMTMLLQAIEANSQTYARRKAKEDHRQIMARANTLFGVSWNVKAYEKFAASI